MKFGPMRPEEIYTRPIHFINNDQSREETIEEAQRAFSGINIVSYQIFEESLDQDLRALWKKERQEKIDADWHPCDTGLGCTMKGCTGKIYWKHNPEFARGTDAPWGSLIHDDAHCTECHTIYARTRYIGTTLIDSHEPMPDTWKYQDSNDQSFHICHPEKRADFIWQPVMR
jgi:hypothetical protein